MGVASHQCHPTKTLKNLHALWISSFSVRQPNAYPILIDKDVISISQNMSKLIRLKLEVKCFLTTATITALAKLCPSPFGIKLFEVFDLYSWQYLAKLLFPELRELSIDSARYGERNPETLGGLLLDHASKLDNL